MPWREYKTDAGKSYYYDKETKETKWKLPPGTDFIPFKEKSEKKKEKRSSKRLSKSDVGAPKDGGPSSPGTAKRAQPSQLAASAENAQVDDAPPAAEDAPPALDEEQIAKDNAEAERKRAAEAQERERARLAERAAEEERRRREEEAEKAKKAAREREEEAERKRKASEAAAAQRKAEADARAEREREEREKAAAAAAAANAANNSSKSAPPVARRNSATGATLAPGTYGTRLDELERRVDAMIEREERAAELYKALLAQ